ncbi:MAG: MATE family efflux transporter [Bacteroidales bacterium]|nr:MATE family efflux transporter [Bacteroidales bacterium]
MTDKTKELETEKIGKLLLIYALPAVISQIIASVYNLVDRMFLGQCVSALAITGLGITMPVMNVIHAFGSLVGAGAAARMSIVLGRKDERWAEKILGNTMLLTFFFGALFVSVGYGFMDSILYLFGADTETIGYAREYMIIVLPGMFLTTLNFNLTGLIRASGYPFKAMWILAGGAILNIILDAIFIYMLDWGIAGAAWATTISMAVSSVFAVAHFIQKSSFIRFRRHGWEPKGYIFRNILMIGISPFSMNIAASAVVALLNHQLISYGGNLAVGANVVVNSYATLIIMLMLGLCQGMQPIAGYNYGAGHSHRLKEVYILTMKICVAVGIFGTITAICFPAFISGFFTDDQALIEISAMAMPLLLVMAPLIGFTITNSQFFQSIDKPWIAIVTSLSRQVLFLIPMMYLVPTIFTALDKDGLTGVFASCTISDVLGAVLAAILLYTQRKVFRPGYVPPARKPKTEHGPKDESN